MKKQIFEKFLYFKILRFLYFFFLEFFFGFFEFFEFGGIGFWIWNIFIFLEISDFLEKIILMFRNRLGFLAERKF
jgi:hypothetical protein